MAETRIPMFNQPIDSRHLDPWQGKRQQRVRRIMEILQRRQRVNKVHFLGEIGSLCGIRRKTLEEYLRDLADYGYIRFEEDDIVWNNDIDQEPSQV